MPNPQNSNSNENETSNAIECSLTESECGQDKSKDSPGKKLLKLINFSPTRDNSNKVECLLLADTNMDKIANHLQVLLQNYGSSAVGKMQPAELLFLLIYTVALEMGFVSQKEWAKHKDLITRLPPTACFHSKNVMRLVKQQQPAAYSQDNAKTHFSLQLRNAVFVPSNKDFSQKPSKALNCLLSAVVTGDFMIVTLTPHSSTEACGSSLCLSIGRYVLSTLAKGKPIQQKFRKLDELSLLLRESLFLPVRNRQLEWLEVQMYPSLNGLPEELYDEILQYLSRNQLNVLANVNRHLNDICRNCRLFKKDVKNK